MANETDPTIMAGGGQYKTISVRGTGFAPQKREELLKPIAEEAPTEVTHSAIEPVAQKVAKVALKAAETK